MASWCPTQQMAGPVGRQVQGSALLQSRPSVQCSAAVHPSRAHQQCSTMVSRLSQSAPSSPSCPAIIASPLQCDSRRAALGVCDSIAGPSRQQIVCRSATAQQAASFSSATQDLKSSKAMAAVLDYAFRFASTAQTYEVNSWMLLLGILKTEQCTAAKVLKRLGLEDLYGAWHEVLWAMNVVDGLEKKPPVPEIAFADRAYHVLLGATRFAAWGGRSKVQTEDLLLALAAGLVLDGMFPDLGLSFGKVRRAIEKETGCVYILPDDDEADELLGQEENNIF